MTKLKVWRDKGDYASDLRELKKVIKYFNDKNPHLKDDEVSMSFSDVGYDIVFEWWEEETDEEYKERINKEKT